MTRVPPLPPPEEPGTTPRSGSEGETGFPEIGGRQVLAHRYLVEELVGGGGMAWVFRGRDLRLDREVAIKILRPQFARQESFRKRFLEEARLAARLNHPNLVTIFDVGEEQDLVFMVMEFVSGENLERALRQLAPMPLEGALYLMVQACAGVGYVHRAGLVHGDLKPSNLLVLPDRRLKVTDFGLAGAIGQLRVETDAQGKRWVWGSPKYLSPEHARGEPLLPASDVYSLGLLLYQLLTGRLPYTASSPEAWLQAHLYQEPIPPRRWRPDLSPKLEKVILKALDKNPHRRFRTADHLGRVLLLFTTSEETRAVPLPEAGQGLGVYEMPPEAGQSAVPSVSPGSTPVSAAPEAASPPGLASNTPAPEWPPAQLSQPVEERFDWLEVFDPLTLTLGVLAALALAGLIPLWVWVYLLYR